MDWTPELILSAISLAITLFVGVFTLIINHRISKINNVKDIHTYQKHITQFELQFRDEKWLYDLIIVRDEFDHYDESSKKRIVKWFAEYASTHELKLLKVDNVAPVEEAKPEEPKSDDQKSDESKPQPEKKNTSSKNKGRKKSKKAADEALAYDALRRAALLHISGQGLVVDPKVATTLHEIKIGDRVIKPTRIVTTIKDEFDED